ncbi:Uncharacterised protein [Vibrio cholerae]|nr:Uncharacterised protein [Vibrio cholerae]CSC65969.1 Uncharacterised protein [Vibrio cholerae]CSI59064.1 Uncharacterised protein [Vibrio cholerae]
MMACKISFGELSKDKVLPLSAGMPIRLLHSSSIREMCAPIPSCTWAWQSLRERNQWPKGVNISLARSALLRPRLSSPNRK